MNAKETISKIADALNIAKGEDVTQETPEVKEEVAPVATEETVEVKTEDAKVEEVKAEETKAEEPAKATEEVKEEEAPAPEVKEEEVKEDPRVAKMQEQIDELQKMLEAAVKSEEVTEEAPEVETKPLTHSPETTPDTNHKKIGGHGGDVMSRVYKYLS